MKNVLLLVEKKSIGDILSELDCFKEFALKNNVTIASFFGFGLFQFDYPSKRNYKDYPLTLLPKFKLLVEEDLKLLYCENNDIPKTWSQRLKSFNALKQKYDEIIIAADYDYEGAFYANQCLNYFQPNWQNTTPYYCLNLSSFPQLFKAFKSQIIDKNEHENNINSNHFLKLVTMGEIKNYFDYNYNLNSQVFFREILMSLGVNVNMTITKNMILLLHVLHNHTHNKFREDQLIKLMNDYKGTNKYSNYHCGIGTPCSTFKIFENLIKLGLLVEVEVTKKNNLKFYTLSSKANSFLELLNKRTFDPDIIGRLFHFMDLEKEEAFKKIDSYIYNYFVEQKRKNKYLK